jgi:hypothetical protein
MSSIEDLHQYLIQIQATKVRLGARRQKMDASACIDDESMKRRLEVLNELDEEIASFDRIEYDTVRQINSEMLAQPRHGLQKRNLPQ